MKNMSKYLSIALCVTGLLFLSYPFVKSALISHLSSHNLQQVNKNSFEVVDVTYNFEDIRPVTSEDVLKAVNENLPVIGEIEVPSVDLHLAIIEGVSNSAMTVGAGTLKPGQAMGVGNYALASHHMKNPKLLFSPLDRVKIGAEVFLSDGETTYRYIVTEKRVIEANESWVIEDQEGRTLVTLITCHADGKKRLLVVGEIK